ncbi:hypothetical protein FA13DRAFT_1716045 [Coprinellus micaceus]|uniref:Uncharacterized protein n=1 Tax=Coprinellus micaceus TaxID=71717 RepID=A0A4Y7SKK9_COPMI|nr:hypothetical protein FA13DRAFT_1716045 [Coprinellus micaceus]
MWNSRMEYSPMGVMEQQAHVSHLGLVAWAWSSGTGDGSAEHGMGNGMTLHRALGMAEFNGSLKGVPWVTEVMALGGWTKVEMICLAIHTKLGQYNRPIFFATSQECEQFFLKLQTVEAAGYPILKMIYTNFAHRITLCYRIVVKGWPLNTFVSPSDIKTKANVKILQKAFTDGTAYFEKLSDDDYNTFCKALSKADQPSEDGKQPGDEEEGTNNTPININITPNPVPDCIPSFTLPTTFLASPSPPTHPMIQFTPANTAATNASPVTYEPAPPSTTTTSSTLSTSGGKRKWDPFIPVHAANSQLVSITKKPRKTQSNKGVHHGPRKNMPVPSPSPATIRAVNNANSMNNNGNLP